jgi:SAM-dependent methyltransferase
VSDLRQPSRLCNLCGTVCNGPSDRQRAPDLCPGCNLRTRHRAYGALSNLIGDPTRNAHALICHANREERRLLFPCAEDSFNFDIRPADFLDGQMDIQDMSRISDASQDTFVAIHVLQQVRDDRQALAEISRVLKPGGLAIFTVPFRRGARTEPYGDVSDPFGMEALTRYGVGTFRRYGLDDFRSLLDYWFAVTMYSFVDPLTGELSSIFVGKRSIIQ